MKAPKSGAVGGTSARINTAGAIGAFTKPCPPSKRASTGIRAVAAGVRGRGRKGVVTKPSPSDRTLIAKVAACGSRPRGSADSSAGDRRNPGSLCTDATAAGQRNGESRRGDAEAALAPASIESLDKADAFGDPCDAVASLQVFADECCSSTESFDVYHAENDGFGSSEWSSSTSSRASSSGGFDSEAPPMHPAGDEKLQGRTKAGREKNEAGGFEGEEEDDEEEEEDGGGDVVVRIEPAEDINIKAVAGKRSRRKHRSADKRRKGRPGEGRTGLDDAWSNRWLTGGDVLVTCYQDCQAKSWR